MNHPSSIKHKGKTYILDRQATAQLKRKKAAAQSRTAELDEPIKLYIADLGAYNAGKLVGEWIELPMEEEDLNAVLKKLSRDGQGDYAIHDYEAPFSIDEHENPHKLNELAEKLEDTHVPSQVIFCAINTLGIASDDWDAAITSGADAFVLEAKDEDDLGYAYLESTGGSIADVDPEGYHFDYDSFGRDLRIDGYGYDEDSEDPEEDFTKGMSDQEVGEHYVEGMGSVAELGQKTIEMYFDYESLGRDLAVDFVQCDDLYISFS